MHQQLAVYLVFTSENPHREGQIDKLTGFSVSLTPRLELSVGGQPGIGVDMIEWSELIEHHGRSVWQIVYRLVNNANDADDCFQEVFLAAYKFSERETVHDFGRLLRRIAYVRGLRVLRDRYGASSVTSLDSIGEVDFLESPEPLPISAAQEAELAEALRQALTVLPEDQAIAHCLKYQEGWDYEQIAEQLAVTPNNVGVLLNRARKRLRGLLSRFDDSVNTRSN
jgi:RNA polymerase sigma-70 factor (ECF subfamily)